MGGHFGSEKLRGFKISRSQGGTFWFVGGGTVFQGVLISKKVNPSYGIANLHYFNSQLKKKNACSWLLLHFQRIIW